MTVTNSGTILTMTGSDIHQLFSAGYGEGPFAIWDGHGNLRIVYMAENQGIYAEGPMDEDGRDVTLVPDDDDTHYQAWMPTRGGMEFAQHNGIGEQQETR